MTRYLLLLMGMIAAMKIAAGIAPYYGWTSDPMTLDIESGTRETQGVEKLAYDAAWVVATTNGVTFKVSVNGIEKNRVGAYGVLDWREQRPGTYAVTAQAYQEGALVGELFSAIFAVAGHDLVNAEVLIDAANVIYDGTTKRPAVVVRLGDKTLVEGVDYDLSYEDNVVAGDAKVIITGKGSYVDEIERTFTISPSCCYSLDIESGSRMATGTEMLTIDPSWLGEAGSIVRIAVNGSFVDERTESGTVAWSPIATGDYALTYSTYTGGALQPEIYTATFAVQGESVSFDVGMDAEVYPYQGAAVVPKVTVTYNGVQLVEGKDYTFMLYDNNTVGVGRMVILGKGAYSGMVENSFYILACATCSLDINSGIRIATSDETIRYSNIWSGEASSKVRVSVKDMMVVEEQGTGDWVWTPTGVGLYDFKHTTITSGVAGELLTAQFYVPGTMMDATVSLAFSECFYDGTAVCPKVVVTQDGKTLIEGLDYTVTYAQNDRPGTGLAIVYGAKGEIYEATFRIRPAGRCFLNIENGIRDAEAEEYLAYDTLWQGMTNANYRMTVNGVALASGTGTGEVIWRPSTVGNYKLSYHAFVDNVKIGEEWTANFRIAGKDIVNATITLSSDEIFYNGTALKPKPTIEYMGETLVEGLDYTLEYVNNINVGAATMIIRGEGRFSDVIKKTFVIRPAGVCSLDIESGVREAAAVELLNYDMAWDGATTAKIAVNGADLATVSGVGMTDWRPTTVGDYTVTYRSYQGSEKTDTELSAKFHITGKDLVNATITFDNEHILYDGTPRTPRVEVVYQGETLVEGVDYSVKYENNVSGVGRVIITGMGRFHDEIEKTFKIQPAGQCSLDICSGTRMAHCPEKITYDENWFSSTGAGYVRIMQNGSRIAQENGKGEYVWNTDEKGLHTFLHRTYVNGYLNDNVYTATFFIGGGSLTQEGIEVSLNPISFEYDGLPKTPAVTVTHDGIRLTEGVDYNVSYRNNIEVGTGYVIVNGIGEYSDLVEKSFIISPVRGVHSLEAKQRYPWNGMVDIDLAISGDPNGSYLVNFEAYDTVGETNIIMNSVFEEGGMVTNNVLSLVPGPQRLIWNADRDLPYEYINTGVVLKASIEMPEFMSAEATSFAVQSEIVPLDIQYYPVTFTDMTSREIKYEFENGKAWSEDAENTKTNNFSYKSYAISHYGSTYLTATVKGKGSFSFWWKVSSESGYDYLKYFVNGAQKASISGSQDWALVTIPVTSTGETTIKWTYSKDGSVSRDSDCGWIDASWTPDAVIVTNMPPSWTEYIPEDQWMPTRKLKGVTGITYSSRWNGDVGESATAVVSVDGTKWIEKTGEGVEIWSPTATGTYVMEHNVQNGDVSTGERLRAKFIVQEIEPVLSGISVAQRYPWNGLVDVKYVLDGGVNQNYNAAFEVNDEAGGTNIPARTFWLVGGNTTNNVLTVKPGNLHFVWDANADIAEDGEFPAVSITVKVEPVLEEEEEKPEELEDKREKVQLWEGGPYWATTNIGAEKPEDYGYYFWWGDTVGYKRENDKWVASDGSNSDFSFSSGNTPTYNKSVSTLQSEGWITSDGILAPEHDAANIHWGNGWRMPTKVEFEDLINNCDWVWTTMNNVKGYIARGRGAYASNSIFLPAAGCGDGTTISLSDSSGEFGDFWSSVPTTSDSAYLFYYRPTSRRVGYYSRANGRSVRPIIDFIK